MNQIFQIILAGVLFSFALKAEPKDECAELKSSGEKMICQSADLTELNIKLNHAYAVAIKNANVAQSEKIKRDQHKWRTQRDQCTTHDCLHTAIMNRITVLDLFLKNSL